jgi:4-hydroxybenzoate polyprenyltransferase
MISFLKLIRFPNLLLIAFTQYMIRLCLIEPSLHLYGMYVQMSDMEFALLVVASVFIAAGGYIINDYFDVRIDLINKPGQMVIDKGIKRRVAMGAHAVLSSVGVIGGIYISWRCNIFLAGGTLFTVSVIALWFYSTSLKYRFLTGNLLISFFTAMIPFMVALFEIPLVIIKYNSKLVQMQYEQGSAITTTLLVWAGAFAIASFGLSLIREIIKDTEDIEGDKEYGCRTIPIVLGIKKAKTIVSILVLFFMAAVAYLQYSQFKANDKYSFFYFLLLIQFPFAGLLFCIARATEKKHFHFASTFTKLIMLAGICYLFLLKFILLK